MRLVALASLAASTAFGAGIAGGTGPAAAVPCGVTGNLAYIVSSCVHKGGNASPASGNKPSHNYTYSPVCASRVNGACAGSVTCTTADGSPGVYHDVSIDGGPPQRWCIGDSEAAQAGVVTPDQVARAMRDLDWPASPLVIQPPDGLTLINFDTNYYTTNTAPISQQVTLLEQQVTIEATPTRYRWDFGDGETTETTTPGAAYPDLTITHQYLRKGSYQVGLATTYAGRYRVGDGAWQDIPDTVTIDSPPQPLRAIEAKPKLVGY